MLGAIHQAGQKDIIYMVSLITNMSLPLHLLQQHHPVLFDPLEPEWHPPMVLADDDNNEFHIP
jgi:hypothetical protein